MEYMQICFVVVVMIAKVFSAPASIPSNAIKDMMQKLEKHAPLQNLTFSKDDEEWGVYLLFGDEREESGMNLHCC